MTTPIEALDTAMLNIAEAMPELTEKELHLYRIKAGFHHPEWQDTILDWIVRYCDQHQLERGYASNASLLTKMRHDIHSALQHIMRDDADVDEQAHRLGLNIVLEFSQLREPFLAVCNTIQVLRE